MTADPKPAPRIVDRHATKRTLLRYPECAACGERAANGHHVIPKGERGDDVIENIVGLCGSGTMGCHGAWHGNPSMGWIEEGDLMWIGKRDREWVTRQIGLTLVDRRQDVVEYVLGKLGEEAGWDYLRRKYYVFEGVSEA